MALKKLELPIVSDDVCQTALRTTGIGRNFLLHSSFVCAGGELGRDTCEVIIKLMTIRKNQTLNVQYVFLWAEKS